MTASYSAPAPSRQAAAHSLCAIFASHAAATPDAVALVDGEQRISYGELARATAAIRAALDARGIGVGDRVGISLDRSWRVIAAIVAILQHGCTYVPLDPEYPAERLKYMVTDSGVAAICAEPGGHWPFGEGPKRIDVDGSLAAAPRESDAPRSDQPAYIIYTSGSTGTPKGVAVADSSVVRLFDSTAEHFSLDQADVWILLHSYSFDFSVWEIWGALLYGGRLVITAKDTAHDPRRIAALIEREGVTVLNQVPSAFRYLVRALEREPRPLPKLRYVIFGGEALDRPSVRRWFEAGYSACELVNMYGITEATVHATYALLTRQDVAGDGGPTRIGHPLAHMGCVLLDESDRPVADGEIGQIHLAGPSLALGYVGRPDLTDRRFPWLTLNGTSSRWYRTGDLARRRPDGQLEYLGRMDDQVQLNGFRIELGEIECVLRRLPGVADAMVAVRRLPGGEAVLHANVVPAHPECAPSAADLRSHCRTSLPAHMVPNLFRAVAALALTPSGKLDRSADPAPLDSSQRMPS